MKIAVINHSGNVGKTTISKMLVAHLKAAYLAVESINAEDPAKAVRGREFIDIHDALHMTEKSVIVDVGSSNVEDFTLAMSEFYGSHEMFDLFIVPASPGGKQIADTIATIENLAGMGAPAGRISVVFNMLERGDEPRRIFSELFEHQANKQNFTICDAAVIRKNELFTLMREMKIKKSIADLAADGTDYKGMIAAAGDQDEKLRLTRMIAIKRLAQSVTHQVDIIFRDLHIN